MAHQEAKNILAFYYGYIFTDEMPEFNEPKSANVKKPGINISSASATLKVYPNPSHGQTIFEYRYPSVLVDLYLEVYNVQGVLLERVRLQGNSGVYMWDCKNCPSGSYAYRTTSNGSKLDSGVLQINR